MVPQADRITMLNLNPVQSLYPSPLGRESLTGLGDTTRKYHYIDKNVDIATITDAKITGRKCRKIDPQVWV